MNPPSALHGAMSRDRKPFTYTPGGLDLSEIKSERMAKRLMRNAMNQGVPEVPLQSVHSQSNPSAPVALPNFNCLPVQVFPTFNLPANPKSLLRTRSHPDQREAPVQRVAPPFVNKVESSEPFNNNNKYTPTYPQVNNNRPASMYEYNSPPPPVSTYTSPRVSYGSDGYTAPLLPEISYDAEYLRAPSKVSSATEQLPELKISEDKDILPKTESVDTSLDLTIEPLTEVTIPPILASPVTKPLEDNAGTENEQREVKVVKKQVKKENKVEEQNGNQNGDEASVEAEMTVKLPTKKSAAKTETKVEVVKKILPDGSVEEVKTTTTRTTIDGRTEIKTKTETTIIPKEPDSEEEVVEEEEEEQAEVEEVQEEVEKPETTTVTATVAAPKENGQESKVVKTEERSESTTTTTKKVVVVQDSPKEEQSIEVEEQEEQEEEVEEEEVEEAEPVTVVLKKQATPEPEPEPASNVVESKQVEEQEEEEEVEEEVEEEIEEKPQAEAEKAKVETEEEEVEEEEVVEVKKDAVEKAPPKEEEEEEEEVEEEEEYEEAEEKEETKVEVKQETEVKETKDNEEKEEASEEPAEEPKESPKEPEEKVIKVEIAQPEEPKPQPKEEKPESAPQAEYKIPIREPSIPLEKVEDVEIKPIGSSPIISKTHTENTEIIRSTIDPKSGLSTQTEYNKIENIVTVNRTTKILDHNYENLTQQGIPTVKTYFPPPSLDRISTSPLPSRPYQPSYQPEPTTERRHSLLLERLSMERQMPSDIYQYGNQPQEQPQYQDEPRAEVLTVSNVKPSSIASDQQWYKQTNQQNLIYNNVLSTPTPASQPWAQPKSQPQAQQQYQPQPQYQPQQQYQPPPPQPQYQPSPTPQPQYQSPLTPQPQYQPSHTPQPQYQHSYSEPAPERAPTSYSTYTPTPKWASNTEQNTSQSTQYSYLSKDTSDSYNKTPQQYSSGYVPPPWEQDSSYTSVNNTSTVYYQPAPQPQTQSYTPAPTSGWKPPSSKFSKNPPIAYIPPAPNQSFVRSASVSEPPRTPGRKTYYSEYERRYITVPESTYIPTETKYQPQPDPSPQYYYDNNEPSEEVEPQWRRELREFTEKTSQTTTTTEQTTVQPPWETDAKYAKNPSVQYTPTPTWSQTLRPRSWRERSFESEYVSQEWPKTNTLGRGRPLSTIGKSLDSPIPERSRGVSVDRYNPSSYHSPAEHPPVQAHTLTTPVAGYHNPNVPAYHARASAEPREQPTSYHPRAHREARASPLQSRSFKYLQWITGTEN
ncbi:titin-like isoform X1 [Helicoverpa zea]|uniref:titin-like isoform X1 n=1 Tax=Helicoverpa zea TaxID=7113 RepID=UPI001F58A7F9|nr:titin-like isoform X1 [Helicoverpa zea]